MAKATHWYSWQRAIAQTVQNLKRQNSKGSPIKLLVTVGVMANLAACQPNFHHSTAGEQAATAAQPSFKPDEFGALQDQGRQRTYYLHTPPNYQSARPMPLVLAFHGSGQQGKPLADLTGLNQLADQQGFIVAYPDGIEKKWNVSGKAATGEDNVAFVDALLTHLKQIRAIDTRRIYVTGISNGGILVQKLACQRPQEIAAFATVAASLPHQFTPTCQTKTPISLIMINGTADAVVPWNGGAPPKVQVGRQLSIPPIPAVINFWQQRDGCTSPATTQTSQNDRVEISRYANCRTGSEVVLVALKGAGHIWTKGGQSAFPDSGQIVWNFFQRHSL